MSTFIKSQYFQKIIFSFIRTKKALNIIKYSKKLKKALGFTNIDYKNASQRHISFYSQNKGKEYDSLFNKLIFEGEYKNGKRNGYGIEYDIFRELKVFEGEYKNGKRHGKGKEYKASGKVGFEGEYKEGKKWTGSENKNDFEKFYELKEGKGYVIESDFEELLVYKGEYLNGERNGKGIEYYNSEKIFEGEYINGKKWNGISYFYDEDKEEKLEDGKGQNIFDIFIYNGKIYHYKGVFFNGERNGKGRETEERYNILFEGEFLGGERKEGNIYLDDNLTYKGEFLNNLKKKGKEYKNNKIEFEGEFLYNEKWTGKGYDEDGKIIYELNEGSGKIKKYFLNGNLKYEGDLLNMKKHGNGKEYFLNGEKKFIGKYKNGEMWEGKGFYKDNEVFEIKDGNGYIKIYNSIDYKLLFEGEYKNGKKTGMAKEYEYKYFGFDKKAILIYEGFYLDGKRNGKGKEYYKSGELKYEGNFKEGLKCGEGKEYFRNGKTKFIGEYKKGKMWDGEVYDENNKSFKLKNGTGKIKIFDDNLNIIFKGEFKEGEKNGKGIEYFQGEIIYRGSYSNGKKVGKGEGKEFNEGGKLLYEGEFFDGLRHGKGKEYNIRGDLIYQGCYSKGERIGKGEGKEFNEGGKILYEGEYYNGIRNGKGKDYTYKKELKIEVPNIFTINILDGKKREKKYDYFLESIYEGNYENGLRNGEGKEYNKLGEIIYDGGFLDGQRSGKGIEYDEFETKIFEGEYENGQRNGKGIEYNERGDKIFEGEYKNGKRCLKE